MTKCLKGESKPNLNFFSKSTSVPINETESKNYFLHNTFKLKLVSGESKGKLYILGVFCFHSSVHYHLFMEAIHKVQHTPGGRGSKKVWKFVWQGEVVKIMWFHTFNIFVSYIGLWNLKLKVMTLQNYGPSIWMSNSFHLTPDLCVLNLSKGL